MQFVVKVSHYHGLPVRDTGASPRRNSERYTAGYPPPIALILHTDISNTYDINSWKFQRNLSNFNFFDFFRNFLADPRISKKIAKIELAHISLKLPGTNVVLVGDTCV